MTEACEEHAGKILLGKNIHIPYRHRGPAKRQNAYICVKLNRRWKWQWLETISLKTFGQYRNQIFQFMQELGCRKESLDKNSDIKISNCTGIQSGVVNGLWVPILEEERDGVQVYKKGTKWLYPVKCNNGDYEWWVGDTDSMKERKAYGYFHQALPKTNSIIDPWEVTQWQIWNVETRTWESINTISVVLLTTDNFYQQQLKKEKEKIEKNYKQLSNELLTTLQLHKAVSKELYNNLTVDNRLKLIKTPAFINIFSKRNLCSLCFADKKTKKCIHYECSGACADCHGNALPGKPCVACGKEQKIECPICMVMHPADFINLFPCHHGICWKCYSKAFEAKRPIKLCPLCRKKIT